MATKTWVGTTSGNVGDYSTAANWNPTGVPVAGDDVRVDGSQNITSGLNQSAVALKSFAILSSYTGKIGRSGSRLQLEVDETFTDLSAGEHYIDLGTNGNDETLIRKPNTNNKLWIQGNSTAALIARGKVDWNSGTLAELLVEYVTSQANDAVVTLQTPTVTAGHQLGGTVTMEAAGTLTAWDQLLGTMIAELGTVTLIRTRGGIFRFQSSTAALGNLYIYGGSAYVEGTDQTITDCEVHAGGLLDTRTAVNATFTNPPKNYGGRIEPPYLATVTFG